MKNKLFAALMLVGAFAALMKISTRVYHMAVEAWAMEFPVEGLVVRDRGSQAYEPVPLDDIKNLSRSGLPEALLQLKARVRHLVIYLDCHYFFTTDGRVIVMTLSADGGTPQLVETKHWTGAPHEFHDYRKELLPST